MANTTNVTIVDKNGSPVKVDSSTGAIFVELTNAPTIDIGKVAITDSGGSNTIALETAGADATSNTFTSGDVTAYLKGFNGSTWDRLLVDANKYLKTTSTLPVTATATLTRPANTTAYAATQQVSATANGGTGSPLSFTLAGVNAGGGVVATAHLVKSSTSTTNATFRLFLFDSAAPTLTNIGDRNTYAMPAIADYAAYVGYFDFNSAVAGSDGCWFEGSPSQSIVAFLAAGGSKVVYGVLVCTGAYTPTSGEVFDVRLTALPN